MSHPSQPTNSTPTSIPDPSAAGDPPHTVTWPAVLDAFREAGTDAGTDAADWWAQDTVGGRATGDTTRTARAVLAGIDDGDPTVLDALPGCHQSDSSTDAQQLYVEAAPDSAPPWTALDPGQRAEAVDAYRDGFDTAVQDRVAQHCRTALPDSTGGTGDRAGSVPRRLRG